MLRLATTAALCLLCAAPTPSAQNVDKLVGRLEAALQKTDTLRMIEAADAILSLDDTKPAYLPTLMALSAKSAALVALERYALAIPVASRAVEMAPGAVELRLLRAQAHAALRQYAEAVDDLLVAEGLAAGDEAMVAEVQGYRAHFLSEAGRHAEAAATYSKLLDGPGDRPTLLAKRGEVLYRAGDVEGALEDLAASLDLRPDAPLALLVRVDVFIREGRYAEARADLDRSIALGPEANGDYLYAIALVNRGYVRWQRGGDADAALSDVERGLGYMPDNPFGFRARALLRLDAGDTAGACDDLGQALLHGFYERFGPHFVYGPDVRELLAEHCAVEP